MFLAERLLEKLSGLGGGAEKGSAALDRAWLRTGSSAIEGKLNALRAAKAGGVSNAAHNAGILDRLNARARYPEQVLPGSNRTMFGPRKPLPG